MILMRKCGRNELVINPYSSTLRFIRNSGLATIFHKRTKNR